MKNIKSIIFVVLISCMTTYGQVAAVVSAPALEATANQTLIKTASMIKTNVEALGEAQKTVSNLEKSLSYVEKVSNYILDVPQAYNIVKLQADAVNNAVELLHNFSKDYSSIPLEQALQLKTHINSLLKEVEKQTILSKQLLSSGIFNMNDADRLLFLDKMEKDATDINTKFFRLKKGMKRANDNYKFFKK